MAAGNGRAGPRRSTVRVVAGVVALALVIGLVAAAWLGRDGRRRAAPALDPSRAAFVPTALPSAAPPAAQCPAPAGYSDTGVRIGLARTSGPGPVVSFGLPLPPGAPAS